MSPPAGQVAQKQTDFQQTQARYSDHEGPGQIRWQKGSQVAEAEVVLGLKDSVSACSVGRMWLWSFCRPCREPCPTSHLAELLKAVVSCGMQDQSPSTSGQYPHAQVPMLSMASW